MNYADTNWLEAVYIVGNTAEGQRRRDVVSRFMRSSGDKLGVTHIVLLEAQNVFRRTTGERSPQEWRNFEADFGSKIYIDPMNWDLLRRECYHLFEHYAWKETIGTFDIAVIAAAKLGGATRFLSFDSTAKAIAVAEGLAVFPALEAREKQIVAKLRG